MHELSTNQMHGKAFENSIKAANGIFKWSTPDRKRSPNEGFDIGKEDDTALGIPTSIKSLNEESGIISLSDARSFWNSFDHAPYRLLVGTYEQDGACKVFTRIHEIILRDKYCPVFFGSVSRDEVKEFHHKLHSFGPGRENQVRASEWAKRYKNELKSRCGLVTLNPKIDSKKQRRLQCSVRLEKIIEFLEAGDHRLYTENFGKLVLPLKIVSGSRKLKKSSN